MSATSAGMIAASFAFVNLFADRWEVTFPTT